MPILAIKNNPPSRYPNAPILETDLSWYIAKVRPRQEKALAFDLIAMQIGYYLPLFTKSIKRPDNQKKRTSILPLFPSYVPFECARVPSWLVYSDRICGILEVKEQRKFKQQLSVIYRARESRTGLSPVDPIEFMVGKPVRIAHGPCAGMIGKMVKRINADIFVLHLEGLGYAGIHVNANCLEEIALAA